MTVTSKDHFTVNGTLTVYGQSDSSGTIAGLESGGNKIIGGSGSLIINGGGIISDVDTLYLENVTVSGNKTAGSGGGIYWHTNDYRYKLVVSDYVRVTGNTTSEGSANNVYLPDSQVYVKVTETLSNDTLIGVST